MCIVIRWSGAAMTTTTSLTARVTCPDCNVAREIKIRSEIDRYDRRCRSCAATERNLYNSQYRSSHNKTSHGRSRY